MSTQPELGTNAMQLSEESMDETTRKIMKQLKHDLGFRDVCVVGRLADDTFVLHRDVEVGCQHQHESSTVVSRPEPQTLTLAANVAATDCPKVQINGRTVDLCNP